MKYYTCNFNNHPLYQQVIDKNIKSGFNIEVITKPTAPHKYKNLSPTHLCDIERFWLLLNDPDATFIDADTIILNEVDFTGNTDRPYLYGVHSFINSCVMVGNGAKGFFELIYTIFDGKNKPTHYFSLLRTIYRDKFLSIPEGYFRHMSLGLLQRCPPEVGCTISGNGFSVENIQGNLTLNFQIN